MRGCTAANVNNERLGRLCNPSETSLFGTGSCGPSVLMTSSITLSGFGDQAALTALVCLICCFRVGACVSVRPPEVISWEKRL